MALFLYLLFLFRALSNATKERGPIITNKTPMTMRVGCPMTNPRTSIMTPKTKNVSAKNESNGFSVMVFTSLFVRDTTILSYHLAQDSETIIPCPLKTLQH